MPYYRKMSRRAQALRPIQTRKEVVDSTAIGVAAATNTEIILGQAVNDYTGVVGRFETGSVISGFYLFFQIQPEAAQGNVDWYIIKVPGQDNGVIALPTPGTIGGSVWRNKVLHEEKGIPGIFNNGSSPLTFRAFVRIPPKLRRFAEDDKISIVFRGSTVVDACMKCIYKVKL